MIQAAHELEMRHIGATLKAARTKGHSYFYPFDAALDEDGVVGGEWPCF